MEDFNDEPFNRSVTDHALAVNNKIKTLMQEIRHFIT